MMSEDINTLNAKRTVFGAADELTEAAKSDDRGLEDWHLAQEKKGYVPRSR